jgi:hypothetical protein
MNNHLFILDYKKFQDKFLSQVLSPDIDYSYGTVIKILLYYIWRGIIESRNGILIGKADADLALLCLATFKSFLPIIQNIRLGYPSDASILSRGLMERIALLGFLYNNPDQIPRYKSSKYDFHKKAMDWAKESSLENWMRLYSALSKVAHSYLHGEAGYIFDNNSIGEAIRQSMYPLIREVATHTDELLALIIYGLAATDPFISLVFDNKKYITFPNDINLTSQITNDDITVFRNYLVRMVDEYTSQGNRNQSIT